MFCLYLVKTTYGFKHLELKEGLGVLVPDGQQLFMVRDVDGRIVKTPLILQQAHGLNHLFPDTSAVKDENDDKDNVPTIANNAPIDYEPLVHSENRDDLATCATTLTWFNLDEFNTRITNILAAQHPGYTLSYCL